MVAKNNLVSGDCEPRYEDPLIEAVYRRNLKTLEDATNLSRWQRFVADLKWAFSF